MKKLMLCVSLAIWGVITFRTGPTPDVETTMHAQTALLPPVSDYTAGSPLPSGGYTHLVVAYCQDRRDFSAAFVDASSGTVVSLLRGLDPSLTSRFLSAAYGLGVPVTVYTAPVIVLSEEQPPPTGSTEGSLPIAGVFFPTCTVNGDIADPPPGGGTPTGQESIAWWSTFGDLALNTAQGLDKVSRAPPPPTSP